MDQDIFPNPLVRTDLPVRRRRWPRVLLGGAGLLIVSAVFLPQILSSKVGRKFVVNAIASRTKSEVTLETFKTSWFGGTQITFLNIKDGMGRRIGCKSISCKAGLLKLLRNRFDLGETTVDGLHLDWVVDDGRGNGTGGRIKSWAGAPPGQLPVLSGKIKINSGTIILYRGTVQPKLYNVTWEQARLESLSAELDIKSLDQPWTYTLDVDVLDDNGQRGNVSSSGTVDVGDGGRANAATAVIDLTAEAKDLPTGPLGAALIPGADEVEVRQVLGPVLASVKLAIKAHDGTLTLAQCEASGGGCSINLPATFDIASTPATITLATPAKISCGISRRLAGNWAVYLDPFLREAAGGAGQLSITFDNLSGPLSGPNISSLAARGSYAIDQMPLARFDEIKAGQALPENLASQVALITGDSHASVMLSIARTPFAITDGQVVQGSHPVLLNELAMVMEGSTGLDGALRHTCTIDTRKLSGALGSNTVPLALPLTGTTDKPVLGVLTPRGLLPDATVKALSEHVNAQVARMAAREIERSRQSSQEKVNDLLRPLQPPSTSPVQNQK